MLQKLMKITQDLEKIIRDTILILDPEINDVEKLM